MSARDGELCPSVEKIAVGGVRDSGEFGADRGCEGWAVVFLEDEVGRGCYDVFLKVL